MQAKHRVRTDGEEGDDALRAHREAHGFAVVAGPETAKQLYVRTSPAGRPIRQS